MLLSDKPSSLEEEETSELLGRGSDGWSHRERTLPACWMTYRLCSVLHPCWDGLWWNNCLWVVSVPVRSPLTNISINNPSKTHYSSGWTLVCCWLSVCLSVWGEGLIVHISSGIASTSPSLRALIKTSPLCGLHYAEVSFPVSSVLTSGKYVKLYQMHFLCLLRQSGDICPYIYLCVILYLLVCLCWTHLCISGMKHLGPDVWYS